MKLIYVCGTARSGTSAVAQLLERMGASTLPKTVGGAWNPDYQENLVINALATAIHPWHKLDKPNADLILMRGMAAYISEHMADRLIVKCPAFPFMLTELEHIGKLLQDLTGERVDTHYVCTVRRLKPQVQSLQLFTGGYWDHNHWGRVIEAGRIAMINNIERRQRTWIDFDILLEDWRVAANLLAADIQGLTVPGDGGIDPQLNHFTEADDAA